MATKEKFYEYVRNSTHGKKWYVIQGSRKMFLTVPVFWCISSVRLQKDAIFSSHCFTLRQRRNSTINSERDHNLKPLKTDISMIVPWVDADRLNNVLRMSVTSVVYLTSPCAKHFCKVKFLYLRLFYLRPSVKLIFVNGNEGEILRIR